MANQSYDVNQKPGESLERYYRRLAKTADQRLVRLQAYSHDKEYGSILQLSYKTAMRDIRKWSGPEALRFNTKMPEGDELIIAKINDIKKFLQSTTSTKQGAQSFKKAVETVNQKYGTTFTWRQYYKFYTSELYKSWDEKFGSKTALETIAAIQKNKKKVMDAIESADKKVDFVDDDLISQKVEDALKDQNLKIKQLF